jgi:hypothetical protein
MAHQGEGESTPDMVSGAIDSPHAPVLAKKTEIDDFRNEIPVCTMTTPVGDLIEAEASDAQSNTASYSLEKSSNRNDNCFVSGEENQERTIVIEEEEPRETYSELSAANDKEERTASDAGIHSNKTPVFLNRLSSWRQMANENATALWKKGVEQATSAANVGTETPKQTNMTGSTGLLKHATLDGAAKTFLNSVGKATADTNSSQLDETKSASAANELPSKTNEKQRCNSVNSEEGKACQNRHDSGSILDDIEDESMRSQGDSSRTSNPTFTPEGGSAARGANRPGVAALQWAATSVVDSVQAGYFRGRYSQKTPSFSRSPLGSNNSSETISGEMPISVAKADPTTRIPSVPTTPASQTARILQSPQANHLHALMQRIEPHEYIMLLGRGMLGVNLKQCYLKNQGVYVDYLVKNGAADQSAVIYVGDLLVSVGDVSLRKGTILKVPETIARAKRPAHVVLATPGHVLDVSRINYLDIAIAMIHQVQGDSGKEWKPKSNGQGDLTSTSQLADHSKGSRQSIEQEAHGVDACSAKANVDTGTNIGRGRESSATVLAESSSFECEEQKSRKVVSSFGVDIPFHTSTPDGFCNPTIPPPEVQDLFKHNVAIRNNEANFSIMELCSAVATNDSFRNVLRHAFMLCAIDGRRFPFLAKHLSSQEECDAKSPPTNALLMLFLEMINFSDVFAVTPPSRRREVATRIAHKFFLPTLVGGELVPPMFDFHHLVSDTLLRHLECLLKHDTIPLDLFADFQIAAVDVLSEQPFLTFLVSNQCARLRAFLRNTTHFRNISLRDAFDSLVRDQQIDAKKYFAYVLIYLLCLVDKESVGEHDDLLGPANGNSRVEEAASGICAAFFIQSTLLPLVNKVRVCLENLKDDLVLYESLIMVYERSWEMFLAPGIGALEHSALTSETEELLEELRSNLESIKSEASQRQPGKKLHWLVKNLVDDKLVEDIKNLSNECLYDYVVNFHAKFREHKFHEWFCSELATNTTDIPYAGPVPKLPPGSIKRLLRRADFPAGVSEHKPIQVSSALTKHHDEEISESLGLLNAECAVVFGSAVDVDMASQLSSPVDGATGVRRFACQSVSLDDKMNTNAIRPDQVPLALETYASLRPLRQRPFARFSSDVKLCRDGWEVCLHSFSVPHTQGSSENDEQSALFGVSLVFRRSAPPSSAIDQEYVRTELVQVEDGIESKSIPQPFVFEYPQLEASQIEPAELDIVRRLRVPTCCPIFNAKAAKRTWTQRAFDEARLGKDHVTIGLVLVSHQNVILAMRETLQCLLKDFSRFPGDESNSQVSCQGLVDVLGNFAHQDVEGIALRSILLPYMTASIKPWIERPISAQKDDFLQLAGKQLVRSLPPIALALLFVTALLEQKIVLSSSRRSVLLSATTALSELLKPLEWCHLIVPLVPSTLAKDLLQYPAPFILGMPSEDPGIMDLIRELPSDVTLVDLDVGRVILAPSFAHNSELGRGIPNSADTSRVLRSQVLFLAQSLGGIFGTTIDPQTWSCDAVFMDLSENSKLSDQSPFDALCKVCHTFVVELLAGLPGCCYWVEEPGEDEEAHEPTVLFDEDRFFRIKALRESTVLEPLFHKTGKSNELALSMDDFDLVLEVFLRCQSMNYFISTQKRDEMIFAL